MSEAIPKTRRDASPAAARDAWLLVGPGDRALDAALRGAAKRSSVLRAPDADAIPGLLFGRDWDAVVLVGDEGIARLRTVVTAGANVPIVVVREELDVATVADLRADGADHVLARGELATLRTRLLEALDDRGAQTFAPPEPLDEADARRFLAAMARFHAETARAGDLDATLDALAQAVLATTAAVGVEAWRLADNGLELEAAVRAGRAQGLVFDPPAPGNQRRLVRAVFELARPAHVADLQQDDRAAPFEDGEDPPRFLRAEAVRAVGVRSVVAEPLRVDDRVHGALLAFLVDPTALEATRRRLAWWATRAHEVMTTQHRTLDADAERRRLRASLDEAHVGLVACDGDGRLSLINRAMTRAGLDARMGDPAERWRTHWSLTTRDGITAVPVGHDPLSRALRGEEVVGERFVSRSATGRARAWHVHATPIAGPDGTPVGASASFHRDAGSAESTVESGRGDLALRDFRLLLDRAAELAAAVAEARSLSAVWPALDAFVAATTPATRWLVERTDDEDVALTVVAEGGVAPRPPEPGDADLPPDRRVTATLRTGSRALGRLTLLSDEPGALDERHATAAAMAANLVAVAVDHADLVVLERQMRAEAEASASHFRRMFLATPLAVALVALDGDTVLDVNPAFAALVGRARGALVGQQLDDAFGTPVHLSQATTRQVAAGRAVKNVEFTAVRADGRALHALVSAERTEHQGQPALLLTVVDITERLQQEARLRQLATFREKLMGFIEQTLDEGFEGVAFFQRLVESAVAATPGAEAGSLLLRDEDGDRYRFAAAVGFDLDRLATVTFADAEIAGRADDPQPVVVRGHPKPLADDDRGQLLRRHGRADDIKATLAVPIVLGGRRVAALCLDSFSDRDAFGEEAHRLAGAFGTQVASLVKRRALELALERMAYHDHLTGLPNRILFRDRLVQAVARARRNGRRGAALFIDLDNLKVTNDTLGHAVGDALLRAAAQRLRRTVREEDTVARIGGDEFTIVLPDLADASAAAVVAEKLLRAFRTPFEVAGHEVHVTASIGVTVFPDDAVHADALIQHGDMAMYQAKNQGKDRYRFFTADMNRNLLERASLEAQLRKALERDEFVLHFQPRVSLTDGRVTSVEALARWPHPERGWIPPGAFVPVAEDSGLIAQLGRRLLTLACLQARRWVDAGTPTVVAFNLSARQLQERQMVAQIQDVLAETGLEARWLELELTESTVMSNVEDNIEKLSALREMGIRVSIDDFGTAYSSLNYLKRLPATALKIDRSFVVDLDDPEASPHDAGIVRAIVALAHTLELMAIAEGIETVAQLEFLRGVGCEQGQGYLFGRPVPPAELAEVLAVGVVPIPPAGDGTAHEAAGADEATAADGDPDAASAEPRA